MAFVADMMGRHPAGKAMVGPILPVFRRAILSAPDADVAAQVRELRDQFDAMVRAYDASREPSADAEQPGDGAPAA